MEEHCSVTCRLVLQFWFANAQNLIIASVHINKWIRAAGHRHSERERERERGVTERRNRTHRPRQSRQTEKTIQTKHGKWQTDRQTAAHANYADRLKANSHGSYRRIAYKHFRRDSSPWRSLVVIYPSPKTQKAVPIDPMFVAMPFESRNWRSFL